MKPFVHPTACLIVGTSMRAVAIAGEDTPTTVRPAWRHAEFRCRCESALDAGCRQCFRRGRTFQFPRHRTERSGLRAGSFDQSHAMEHRRRHQLPRAAVRLDGYQFRPGRGDSTASTLARRCHRAGKEPLWKNEAKCSEQPLITMRTLGAGRLCFRDGANEPAWARPGLKAPSGGPERPRVSSG